MKSQFYDLRISKDYDVVGHLENEVFMLIHNFANDLTSQRGKFRTNLSEARWTVYDAVEDIIDETDRP